ncbi:MAG: hypothetical protein IJW38_01290 [Clostridia bacterium]|nr:hypothetical protein [Clostridia bacterium]
MEQKKAKRAPLIVLSLVFLLNPNIQVVDLLPDFVAYFIIARLLEKPSIQAPYFEEARSSAIKLAFISLAKIPAFLLAVFIRSKNTLDNDIFPMLSLIFATLEIIFSLGLIKNIFSAFFHLGERGTASALITPFAVTKNGKLQMRPEDLRGFTVFFAVAKCLLYTVPEFLLLSKTAENGTITPSPLSRYYPITLSIAFALGLAVGIIWFMRSKKFLNAVVTEGEFESSLKFLASEDTEHKYETKLMLHATKRSMFALAIASVFTLPLAFQETELINIFPGFIFALVFILALSRIKPYTEKSFKLTLITGLIYTLISVASFAFSVNFLTKYDYIDISNALSQTQSAAKSAYIPVVIFSALELLALAALFRFALNYFYSFITENTGLSPKSDRYSRTELEYHTELKKRLYIFFGLGLATSLMKLINVCLYLSPKTSFTNANGQVSPVTASAIPWFGVVITIASVLFIGYAIYFTRLIREEVELKNKND